MTHALTPNRFGQFGLDKSKKSKDMGTVGLKFCPWADLPEDDNGFTGHMVQQGFSMCFAHFVICIDCSLKAFDLKNIEKWAINDCFKCNKKSISTYHIRKITFPNDDIAICRDCLEISIQLLNNSKNGKITT